MVIFQNSLSTKKRPQHTELAERIYQLHAPSPPQEPVVDIVFLHGLNSDEFSAWTNADGHLWPETFLKEDVPLSRIITIGYESTITEWSGDSLSLQRRAEVLLNRMLLPDVGIGLRPVIFVTHSMGGLIMKEMLVNCHLLLEPEHEMLLNHTKGIVFYATPHRGASVIKYATILDSLLNNVFRLSKTVNDLQPFADRLTYLNSHFLRLVDRERIKILSFGETKKTNGLLLVEEISANPCPGSSHPFHLVETDHVTINIPATKKADSYQHLLKFCTTVLTGHEPEPEPALLPASATTQPSEESITEGPLVQRINSLLQNVEGLVDAIQQDHSSVRVVITKIPSLREAIKLFTLRYPAQPEHAYLRAVEHELLSTLETLNQLTQGFWYRRLFSDGHTHTQKILDHAASLGNLTQTLTSTVKSSPATSELLKQIYGKDLADVKTFFFDVTDVDFRDSQQVCDYGRQREIMDHAYDDAEHLYNQSIELDGQNPWPLVYLASLYNHKRRQFGKSEEYYKKALEIDSNHTYALNGLGSLLVKRGRIDEAYKYFLQASVVDAGRSSFAYNNLAFVAEERGNWNEAEQNYRRGLEVDPTSTFSMCGLAFCYHRRGDIDQAEMLYSNVMQLEPNNVRALTGLGWLLYQKGKSQGNQTLQHRAECCWLEAVRQNPRKSWALTGLGRLAEIKKDYHVAELYYKAAISCGWKNSWAKCYLGYLYQRIRKKENDAMTLYRQCLDIEPTNSWALANLGQILANKGQIKEADESFQKAIEVDPYNALARQNYAMFLKTFQKDDIKAALMSEQARKAMGKKILTRAINVVIR